MPDGHAIDPLGYADALVTELEWRLERLTSPHANATGGNTLLSPPRRLTTIYVGGGTPTLWRSEALQRVLDAALSAFSTNARDVEITVEANPSSFDRRVADGLLEVGVNRLSLGIQSLDDEQLRFLGRRHDRQQALEALAVAMDCGIPRVSADLLFGLPRQTLAHELAQIVEVAQLPLSHVSAYALTIEQATPFGRLARQGQLPIAVEERVADAFLAVHSELERLGYEHYEISNFAKPRQRSLHNQQYWWGCPYLGLGPAAVGTVEVQSQWMRYHNPPNISQYLDRYSPSSVEYSAAFLPFEPVEILDPETRLRERIMLGLRLREGVDLSAIGRELGVDPLTFERRRTIARLVEQNRLSVAGMRCYIEPAAWLLADGTIAELM